MAEDVNRTGSTSRDYRGALFLSVGAFFFYVLLILTDLPSVLPGYPAVIVSFLAWLVLPGWFLQRALFAKRNAGLVVQTVLAFLMSMALATMPGILALQLHLSVEAFATLYALLAAAVSGMALVWHAQRHRAELAVKETTAATSGTKLLLVLCAVPLIAIAASPWWAGDRIARDADDFVYIGYVNTYVRSDRLDASEPFLDTRQGSFSRMEANVWLVMEALVTTSAGVDGFDLHMRYLPGILTILAVAATFALAKGLFGSRRLALLAAALILVQAFLDLAPQEGIGRMLLLRMAQDKMAASFIFVPAGILLGAWYLEKPDPMAYVGFLLAAGATFVVHPLGLMSLVIAVASIAALRTLVERTRESFQSAAYLVGPWLVLGAGFVGWSMLFANDGDPSFLYLRRQFNITDVPGGMVIGNYHLLLHPMVIAAIGLAVPAWLLAPRHIANQALLGMVGGVLLIFFVPVIATPIAEATRDEAVWRLHRLIPAALILAFVLHYGIMKLSSKAMAGEAELLVSPRFFSWVPGIAVLLVFAVTFFVQEQYAIADDGAFYNRTSDTALLPWTGGSIFLGGVERAFSSDFRPGEVEGGVLDYLDSSAVPGSIVMTPPAISTRYFASLLEDVRPLEYVGAPELGGRLLILNWFYDGLLFGTGLRGELERFDVDYVVAVSRSASEEGVQSAGGVRLGDLEPLQSIAPEEFAVRQGQPELVAVQFGDDRETNEVWALDSANREEVVAGSKIITIPEGADRTQLDISIRLASSATVVEDSVTRIVVTLELLGDDDIVGAPIHTVADVFMEAGSESGALIERVRSPAAEFSAGERYRVRVWRDGGHQADTYADDVWFGGLNIDWLPSGPVLGSSVYQIYFVGQE